MKYCMQCGTKLPDVALFCCKCGTRQDYVIEETPANQTQPCQPAYPAAPAEPVQTPRPAASQLFSPPVKPVEANQRPEPAYYSEPRQPVEPAMPVETVQPAASVSPASPASPSAPVIPAAPQEPGTWKEMVLSIARSLYAEEPPENHDPDNPNPTIEEILGGYIETKLDYGDSRDIMNTHFTADVRNGEVYCRFIKPQGDDLLVIVSDDRDIMLIDPPSSCSYPLPKEENHTWKRNKWITVPHTASVLRIFRTGNRSFDEELQYCRSGVYNSGVAFNTALLGKVTIK